MLEGKEIEGKLGAYGAYSVDVNPQGIVAASVTLQVDIIAELEKLALKSDNQIDDKIIAIVKSALGR